MAGNARFHNKFHRRGHHTDQSTGYPDSGTDPIASQAEPFLGDFYLAGSLSANKNLFIGRDATILGNLSVLGDLSYLDTIVSITSALSVVNVGTGPALTVVQHGAQPIAKFIDKESTCTLLLDDGGLVGFNTCILEPGIGITINNTISSNQALTANANIGAYHFLIGSVAEGRNTRPTGVMSHAEGDNTIASNNSTHAEGYYTSATGQDGAHAEGTLTRASGIASHAEGQGTHATAQATHSEGFYTSATNAFAHAEGKSTLASQQAAHAEGEDTVASGEASHAQGSRSVASSFAAHAEGEDTIAANNYAHAEGKTAVASGQASHAGGTGTRASGSNSFAHGLNVGASGINSFALGENSVAKNNGDVALGFNANAVHAQSLVYSNYSNYYSSCSFADNTFNVFASGGSFLLDPVTVGDPVSAIKFIVAGDGNVGVNTATPSEQLTVNGNISSNSTVMTNVLSAKFIHIVHTPANDGVSPILRIGESDIGSGNAGFSGAFISYNETTNIFGISSVFAASAGLPAVAIDRFSNVGVGTDSPGVNQRLTISGNTSGLGIVTYTSPNYGTLLARNTTFNGQFSALAIDPLTNLVQGRLGINTVPVSSYALHVKGGNIRVDGVDYSAAAGTVGFDGTVYDTDGQSLFDLRSGFPNANYSLSIAQSGLGNFMKFFGGRLNDDKPFINIKKNTPMRFGTFDTFYGTNYEEHMRIGRTGNIGIHTNHPWVAGAYDNSANEALTVNGNISANGSVVAPTLSARFIDLVHTPANDGTNPYIRIGETGNTSGNLGFSGVFISYDESTNVFGISSQFATGTGLPAVAINRFSNVGIGTDSPVERLTVSGNISANGSLFVSGLSANNLTVSGNISASGNLIINGNTTLGDSNLDTLTLNGTSVSIPNNLNFDANTLFINAANNKVGINTNSPGEQLTVNGNISANGTLSVTGAGNNYFAGGVSVNNGLTANTVFTTGSGNVIIDRGNYRRNTDPTIIIGANSDQHLRLRAGGDTSAEIRMTILSSGEVGIGTSIAETAAAKLTVSGNISASGSINALSSNVGIVVNDKTTSYTFTNDDNCRIVHFNTATQSLCAIFPSTLRTDFNCAVMNTGTNVLTLSTYTTLRAIAPNISTRYGAAFVYKDSSNNIYAVGRL